MTSRKSGEIINATLMEVFVVLCFLVISLLRTTEAQVDSEQSQLDLLKQQTAALERDKAHLSDSLAAASQDAEKWKSRYESEYPGDCKVTGVPVQLLRVCIAGDGTYEAEMLGTFGSHLAGTRQQYTATGFKQGFIDVWQYQSTHRCRFDAIVHSEADVPNDQYLLANQILIQRFRLKWSLDHCLFTSK